MNKSERDELIQAFVEVAKLAGRDVSRDQIVDECLDVGHRKPSDEPKNLLYIFLLNGKPLKVGRSFAKKRSTRINDHYNPDKEYTLANYLLKCPDAVKGVCRQEARSEIDQLRTKHDFQSWMEKNLTLVMFRFREKPAEILASLFEVFLQCKLSPVFEGDSTGHGSRSKLLSPRPPTKEQEAALLARLSLPSNLKTVS